MGDRNVIQGETLRDFITKMSRCFLPEKSRGLQFAGFPTGIWDRRALAYQLLKSCDMTERCDNSDEEGQCGPQGPREACGVVAVVGVEHAALAL